MIIGLPYLLLWAIYPKEKIRPEPPPIGQYLRVVGCTESAYPSRDDIRIHYYEGLRGPMTKERCFDYCLEP